MKINDSISVAFGTPIHGWLPVNFQYNDFKLEFDTSDALNDPLEDLYNTVTKLQNNELRRITWWLEPAAYFFDFERTDEKYTLTIIDTDDLHNDSADKKSLIIVTGDKRKIIEPFRIALKQFLNHSYEETNWPYNLDEKKVGCEAEAQSNF